MPKRLNIGDAGFQAAFSQLLLAKRETSEDVGAVVAAILSDVRTRGDDAVIEYTWKFDRIELSASTIRISKTDQDRMLEACEPDVVNALTTAADRIVAFHKRQLPDNLSYTDEAGLQLGYRWTPIEAAGLYVPGGTAAYPSSVLMNALPAKVAGVDRLVMVVPTPDGAIDPLVMMAARIAGIDEIYRIGGAQAVGALAYGTATIAPVDKIVGPGNMYVAAAKRQVFGIVGIDMIAGPSEVLIVADAKNDPQWIAADLLAQAEHDAAAQSILITDDRQFAEAVAMAVEAQLPTLARHEIAAESWSQLGHIITVDDLTQAPALVDRIAPEHLQLAVEAPEVLAQQVRHAGAIFLGRFTPEALGDYVAGPNHVLPTSGSARFSSGLSVLDFLKRTTIVGCGEKGLSAVGAEAIALAQAEGLDAHARSVAIRLNRRRI